MRLLLPLLLTVGTLCAAVPTVSAGNGFDISDLEGEAFFFESVDARKVAKAKGIDTVKVDADLVMLLEFKNGDRWRLWLLGLDIDDGDSKKFKLAEGHYWRKNSDGSTLFLNLDCVDKTTHACSWLINEVSDDGEFHLNAIYRSSLKLRINDGDDVTAKLTGKLLMLGHAHGGEDLETPGDGHPQGTPAKAGVKLKGDGVLD